jgi:hypothetical protein
MMDAKIIMIAPRATADIASPTLPPTVNGTFTGPWPLSGEKNATGSRAAPTTITTYPKNLERRDGSRPVGNSRKTNGMKAINTTHPKASTLLTSPGAGSEPGFATRE